MSNGQRSNKRAAHMKEQLLLTLGTLQALIKQTLPGSDYLPLNVALQKVAIEHITLLRHRLEVVVETCQEIIEGCRAAEQRLSMKKKKSAASGDRSYSIPVAEVEKMIAEAMAIHLFKEGHADRTVSLWVSPSFLTQLVRRVNTNRPFSEPVYRPNEWHCSYELYFKGEQVYSFKELVWSPPVEDADSKLAAVDDKIDLPSQCYQELIELQSGARIDWYQELDDLVPVGRSEEGH